MTVEELIELLQEKDPKAEVLLHFKRYTPVRTRSRATRPVSYVIERLASFPGERWVYLIADQKGDYY